MGGSSSSSNRIRIRTFILAYIPGLIMSSMLLGGMARVRVEAAAAIPCTAGVENHIKQRLTPCRAFLLGNQITPPRACCTGVKSLNAEYKTARDRQRACSCLKDAFAKHQPAFKLSSARNLPGKCSVNIGHTITTANFDCSR